MTPTLAELIAGRNLTHYHEIGLVAPLFHHADQFVDPENRKMCVEPGENYLSNEFIEFETVIAALPPHAESCLLEAHEKWDPPFGESAY